MAPPQASDGWRPPKRLRQLESVAGRGLLLGCSGKGPAPAAAHYVTLSARVAGDGSGGGGSWRLVYRSEAASSANPEWHPLAWSDDQMLLEDPLLDDSSSSIDGSSGDGGSGDGGSSGGTGSSSGGRGTRGVQVLLALHAVDEAQQPWQGSAAANGPRLGAAAGDGLGGEAGRGEAAGKAGLSQPLLPGADSRPEFSLPASPSSPQSRQLTAALEPEAAAVGQDEQQPAAGMHGGEGQQPEGEPARLQNGDAHAAGEQREDRASSPGRQHSGLVQPPSEQEQEERQHEVGWKGAQQTAQPPLAACPAPPANGTSEVGTSSSSSSSSREGGLPVGEPPPAVQAQQQQQQEQGEEQRGEQQQPQQPQQPAGPDWVASVAAALAGTGRCPGRLVAAWQLDSLEELYPAGADLAELQLALQPNTLVLQFRDGLYLCPPPLPQAQVPVAGSLKRALLAAGAAPGGPAAGDELVPGSAAAAVGPARRGFASLLVSKLLRSAPNLTLADVGSYPNSMAAELAGEAGLSDADSDAGSDATAATTVSRLTTATAASELPAAAVAAAGNRASAAAAAAAAAGAQAAPSADGSGAAVRPMTVAGVQQSVASIVAMQGRVQELAQRSQALQAALAERLETRRQRRQQDAALAALAQQAAVCRRRGDEAQAALGEVQQATAAATKQAIVRAQALVTTLKVMQAADRRVSEAEAALEGEGGRGALVAALRELVARRCQMVCQLGSLFQLGPTPVSVLEAPPGGFLEERLEQQWAGGLTSAITGSSSGGAAPGLFGWGRPGNGSYGSGGGAGSMPVFGGGGGYGPDSPSKFRQEMRLSIGGLEVHPWVWRMAFEEEAGHEGDAGEDRAAGIALGYVAQVVDRLGAYLGVALRYPLALRGSRSAVVDCQPPLGAWAEAEGGAGAKQPLFGGDADGAGGTAAPGAVRGVEYPLYCDSNRERPRFAVGVFLLNKDVIQLLQAHGISAAGPNHLLQNLYKLLLAAQSALPHLPPLLGAPPPR